MGISLENILIFVVYSIMEGYEIICPIEWQYFLNIILMGSQDEFTQVENHKVTLLELSAKGLYFYPIIYLSYKHFALSFPWGNDLRDESVLYECINGIYIMEIMKPVS
jgi:hypothetical protein